MDPAPDDTSNVRDPRDWTADEIESVIPKAIEAHDFEGVVALIRLLAIKDPHRAELVYETIELGLDLASRQR